MTPGRLIELYDSVEEAPDAIERLRRFIFDLAVRGKLSQQNQSDVPASQLLREINEERQDLIAKDHAKKAKPLERVDEPPFTIPNSWEWSRLGVIAGYIQRGKSPKYSPDSGIPVVSQKCVQWSGMDLSVAKEISSESLAKYEEIRFLQDGDLLWNSTGTGTIGRIIRLDDPPDRLVCDSHVTVVRCLLVDPEYVRTWLRSDHVYGVIEDRSSGSTNQIELTAKFAHEQPVPLPPLAEQKRIVAKVEELTALLDQLEAARTEREATRDRLTTASLTRLTAPDTDPADFPSHARFALNALPAFASRPDQITTLRRTILDLAVCGKLAGQDPAGEPASELLKRIEAEKARLVKASEIRKPKQFDDVDNPPFRSPDSWEWVRLGRLGVTQTGSTPPKSKSDHYGSDVPFIRPGDLYIDRVDYSGDGLSKLGVKASGRLAAPGSVLMVCIGTIGKCQMIDRPVSFNQQINALTAFDGIEPRYVLLALRSGFFQKLAWAASARSTIAILNKGNWEKLPIPLPPHNEQRRIVGKVEELMSICDRLEVALAAADSARAQLLEALLYDALDLSTSKKAAA